MNCNISLYCCVTPCYVVISMPLCVTDYPYDNPFLPDASFGLRVLSLPASVCVCVCPSVRQSRAGPRDNSSPVSARITKFEP